MLSYENTEQFKKEYREFLNNNGISNAHIARKIGISPQQLNNIWNKKELTVSDLKKLCNAIDFDCTIMIRDMRSYK